MVRLDFLKKFVLICVVSTFCYANFDFTAQEMTEKNQVVGQVLYKDNVVIPLYTTGPFVTEYSRAQMTAYRLNEYLQSYEDISKIKFSYPENTYTASIGGRNLFSIYKEDAKQGNTSVEVLMSEWINNLKVAMMTKITQAEVPETNPEVKSVEPVPIKKSIKVAENNKKTVKEQVISVDTEQVVNVLENKVDKDLFIEDFDERLTKLEAKVAKPLKKGKSNFLLWIVALLNLGLGIYLVFIYQKIKKNLGSYEEVEKTGRMEEIENSVSVLIKELKDVSGEVVDNTIKNIKEVKQETIQEEEPVVAEEAQEEQQEEIKKQVEEEMDIVPDVEVKEEKPLATNIGIVEEVSVADSLEEALEANQKPLEVIKEEDAKELEAVVQHKQEEKKEATNKTAKTDAEKLAEELDGGKDEPVINNPSQTNLSGVGMAELFKILSQLDKDIREEVKTMLNNKSLNKNERIIKLKHLELDTELIAKVLGIGKEEVSLVIQLNDLEAK